MIFLKLPRAALCVLGATALLSVAAGRLWSQQPDASSSASRTAAGPEASAAKTAADATTSASRSVEATSSASRSAEGSSSASVEASSSASRSGTDATSSASRKAGAPLDIASMVYDFAQGTGLRLSLLAGALGILYRVRQYRRLTRKSGSRTRFWTACRAPKPRELTHPVTRTASLAFHVLLFAVPLLLPAHNIMLHRSIHVSLPSIPAPLADWLTVALLAGGAFFLARRIFVPRVRVLSTVYDYLILLIVLVPFMTGLMMYHHVSASRWLMITHILAADILFIAIPFTKLGHMPFLLFSRFFLSGEHSLRSGTRIWGGSH